MLSRFTNKEYRLGDLLVEHGLLSRDQLTHAVAEQRVQGGQLGQILVSLGYISSRQLNCTLMRQRLLRKIAWVVAFLFTPIQLAYARDQVAQPVQLPSWDAPLAGQFKGFDSPALAVSAENPVEFASVSVSLTNIMHVYRALDGAPAPLVMPSAFQPQVDRLMYNVEMAAGGGLRVNLQYRF
jgi:hypothetical protein